MNTRSAIQLVVEGLQAKNAFFEHLADLNSKFEIRNNVFACDKDWTPQEITEGYFGEIKGYDTLEEAAKDFNIYMQGIRISEGKFYVGNLYRDLAAVKEERIIDLKNAVVL